MTAFHSHPLFSTARQPERSLPPSFSETIRVSRQEPSGPFRNPALPDRGVEYPFPSPALRLRGEAFLRRMALE